MTKELFRIECADGWGHLFAEANPNFSSKEFPLMEICINNQGETTGISLNRKLGLELADKLIEFFKETK